MIASGMSRLAALKPKRRPDRLMTHCETGGLSTVMKLLGSTEPNSSAFQLRVPAQAAPE